MERERKKKGGDELVIGDVFLGEHQKRKGRVFGSF